MKSERIRRGVKRTKPDVVELLRREVRYARRQEASHQAAADCAGCNVSRQLEAARSAGIAAAYDLFAERLEAVIDQLTEESK